jgi:hypothetical protein
MAKKFNAPAAKPESTDVVLRLIILPLMCY